MRLWKCGAPMGLRRSVTKKLFTASHAAEAIAAGGGAATLSWPPAAGSRLLVPRAQRAAGVSGVQRVRRSASPLLLLSHSAGAACSAACLLARCRDRLATVCARPLAQSGRGSSPQLWA